MSQTNLQKQRSHYGAAAYISLIFVFFLWGSLYVVSQVVLKYMPTFAVMFCRFVIAFLALTVIIRIQSRGWENGFDKQKRKVRPDRIAWRYILIMGIFGYALAVGVQLLGTKYAGSTMSSLINSLNPVVISLMAIPILHEKLTGNKIVGILMAVAGVYLILGHSGNISIPGIVLSILSVLGWSLVSVLTRQGLAKYNPLIVTRAAIGIAAVCELIFALAEHGVTGESMEINLKVVLGLLYLGILCTGAAYVLWNNALATLPASNCSAMYPLQPLTSAVMGILLFGEKIRLNFLFGSAAIIIGVLITLLYHPKQAEKRGAKE